MQSKILTVCYIENYNHNDYFYQFYCLLITVCPIEGQIYYPECAPCDGTCENPNPPCPRICRPGCACPEGQVIKDGKCIDKTECPQPSNITVILYIMSEIKANNVDSELLMLFKIHIKITYMIVYCLLTTASMPIQGSDLLS